MQSTAKANQLVFDIESYAPYEDSHDGKALYVFARMPGGFEYRPWVVVTESAILRRVGAPPGLGAYSGRRLKRGDILGRYSGTVVNKEPFRTKDEAIAAMSDRVHKGANMLLVLRTARAKKGWDVIDGKDGPAPYFQYANDPRGSRLSPNIELSEYGILRVRAASIPGFDSDKSIEDNIGSELRWNYQPDYWNVHGSA